MSNEGLNELNDSSFAEPLDGLELKHKKRGRPRKEEIQEEPTDQQYKALVEMSLDYLDIRQMQLSDEFEEFKKIVETMNILTLKNDVQLNSELSIALAEFLRVLSISKNPDIAPEHIWHSGNFRIHIQNLSL